VDICVFEALTPDIGYFETNGERRVCSMADQPNQRPALIWHKSSRSGGSGECVEVAQRKSSLLVRDSGNPSGTMLVLTAAQWRGLVRRIKQDEVVQG
jgi:hypothetical protein